MNNLKYLSQLSSSELNKLARSLEIPEKYDIKVETDGNSYQFYWVVAEPTYQKFRSYIALKDFEVTYNSNLLQQSKASHLRFNKSLFNFMYKKFGENYKKDYLDYILNKKMKKMKEIEKNYNDDLELTR